LPVSVPPTRKSTTKATKADSTTKAPKADGRTR
jgi:hypothetical protein